MPNTQNERIQQILECRCVIRNREEGESQREWLKRVMCMRHWMQTDYYQNKLPINTRSFPTE